MKNQNDVLIYSTKNKKVLKTYISTIFHRPSRKILFKYLRTVLKDFFLLQFSVKFGFKKIPIVHIDHPLDDRVPFTPEKVSIYLDFINFWIRPLTYIQDRSGRKAQLKYTSQFLTLVDQCYRNAAEVYRFRMSTTRRPKYYKGNFLAIHLLDPHYLCVPSLHVMIVVLAYNFYKKAFAELDYPLHEQEALNAELFSGAIDITETVLYIKQHSLNCIPAALYSITYILDSRTMGDEAFMPIDAIHFIDQLFHNSDLICQQDASRLRLYIMDLFEQFLLEGYQNSNWTDTVYRWILNYEKTGAPHFT